MSDTIARPRPPIDFRPRAKAGSPGFLAEPGRMWHATGLIASERCRWCPRRLITEIRKRQAFLVCMNCDRPDTAGANIDIPTTEGETA